jgi:1-acyl-sn-glycerol-3-phosphate acyltransferase
MNGVFRHPLRVGTRLAWLAGEITWIALNYIPRVALRSDCSRMQAKARWLHWGCRRVVKIFHLEFHTDDRVPFQGLLVSNHLSYLDVLVFSALTPCVFVAKREVKNWPVFGLFARLAGTVFVDRCRRLQAGASAHALEKVLADGGLAVLFPEGTSSNGQQVLPFKSALLDPVVRHRHPISVSALQYALTIGDVQEEVCYWKNMTLFPHLLNLLSKQGLAVRVRFSQGQRQVLDRKVLARQLHDAVSKLNSSIRSRALGDAPPAETPELTSEVVAGGGIEPVHRLVT